MKPSYSGNTINITFVWLLQGVGLGFALRHTSMTHTDKKYFTFPGEVLLRMLKCLVLPLITSTVITGSTLNRVDVLSHLLFMIKLFIDMFIYCNSQAYRLSSQEALGD